MYSSDKFCKLFIHWLILHPLICFAFINFFRRLFELYLLLPNKSNIFDFFISTKNYIDIHRICTLKTEALLLLSVVCHFTHCLISKFIHVYIMFLCIQYTSVMTKIHKRHTVLIPVEIIIIHAFIKYKLFV